MTESIQLTTVWAVDLVGSTRLETTVGPVRADELRREYFGLLREAIATSGGTEFKNTGDGLLVAFSSASAAVACAVLTQQLFERRYRGAEQRLQVRVGLGTGESTIRDGDYFGMPSIEAVRLCDRAPTDGILVSPATRMLAGRVTGARFEPAGALELKGIPEPMEAFAVAWEPLDLEGAGLAVGRWPLPETLRRVPRAEYVGRATERAALERVRTEARSGVRRVGLLSGEPGIGKTRLASYAALGANADGFAVCWGGCSEDLAVPYEPWIAVCSQLVEHMDEATLTAYVERAGGEISRLAGNLAGRRPDAPRPQPSDHETERFLLFQAVADLLRTVAGSVPLCVVLDDFHWADGQSVALLKHIVRTVERGALQVLVTYRDSDLTKDHPLTGVLADLRRVDGVERVALAGLGPDEVAELLRAVAGHALDADALQLATAVAAETGGNPFFVGEILRSLFESGAITFDEAAGTWHVRPAAVSRLPEGVREVIDHRVDRLGESIREALTVAAVIGRSFDLRLLAQLVGRPEGQLLAQCEAALDAMLLRESADEVGRFTFEHALINHTLYQGLTATRRAALHHQVALALEQLHGADSEDHVADLALHWRLATVAADPEKAAAYSIRAGRRALKQLAPSKAAGLFADALALLGPRDSVERCEALIGLGEAQRLTSDGAYRTSLLEASRIAAELGDGERAARAALANHRGRTSAYGHVDHERVTAIVRALDLDEDPDRRALLLALQAIELLYERDGQRRRALVDEALVLARATGNAPTRARVLTDWFRVRSDTDGVAPRLQHLGELMAAVTEAADPRIEFWAAQLARNVLIQDGEIRRGEEETDRICAIADRLDEPGLHRVAMESRACLALLLGDLAEAERHAAQALELGSQAGEPDAAMIYGAQIVPIRLLQGRGAEVIDLLEQSVRANPMLAGFSAVLAQALCWVGRVDEAAAIIVAAADDFADLPREVTRAFALGGYAEAAAHARITGAAEILYGLIAPWADQVIWNGANTSGHARTYLGLLATALDRHEQADEHYRIAAAFHRREGMHVWEARSELGWAEALAGRGDGDEARPHAARALELARSHGYGAFEPRALAVLEVTGRVR